MIVVHPARPFYTQGEPINWDRGYIDQCYELAKLATCVKAKVGAQVRDPRGILLGQGYNHSPNPACDDCANLCGGGIRQGIKSGTHVELCHAVHAEQWAIHQAGERAKGATLYVASFDADGNKRVKDTSRPLTDPMRLFYCTLCARAIMMAGIKLIVMESTSGILYAGPEDIWQSAYEYAASSI
jgi:dCMP deaminase